MGRERVSGRITDRVLVRVRRPDSSGNLLIRRKIHYAWSIVGWLRPWTLLGTTSPRPSILPPPSF